MKNFQIKKGFLSIATILVVMLTLIPDMTRGSSKSEPIKVGALVPLTGFAVEDGKQYSRALNLAFEEIGWKIGDRKIELIIEDDAYNATIAVQKVKKLFYNDKVKIVIGPEANASALAIHSFIRDNRILTINLMASADQLNTGDNFVKNWFRVSHCKQIANVAGYASYKKGYQKATTVVPDFAPGYDEAAGFKKVFEKMGGKVLQEIRIPLGSIDMVPYLVKIDTNANVIYAFFFGEDAPRFIKQYGEYGLSKRIPLLASGSTVDLPYLKAHGEAALGVESAYFYCENLPIPEMVKFRKAFVEKNKVDVSYAAEAGYMAAQVLISALRAGKGNAEDIDGLISAIEKTDFASTRGRFRFGPEHNPIQDYYLRKVEKVDGRLENFVKEIYPNIYQDWTP